MSYVVTIKRDIEITVLELQSAIQDDLEFKPASPGVELDDGVLDLEWQPEDRENPEYFILSDGAIDVTTPSNLALRKMQQLATKLGAEVVGEEGESLTEVEVPPDVEQGCGPVGWTVIILLVVFFGYWLLR